MVIGYPVHQVSVNEYFPVEFWSWTKFLIHKNPWQQSIYIFFFLVLYLVRIKYIFFTWNGRYNILSTRNWVNSECMVHNVWGKIFVYPVVVWSGLRFKLEWQVFHNTEKTEKSWKLGTKWKTWKITENTSFLTQIQKYQRKSLFSEYFEIKFIIKSSNLLTFQI